jgi:hypothetical protein
MANLSINFITTTVREGNQDPHYRVQITTGVSGTTGSFVDGNLLLIKRKNDLEGPVDVFYGIVKAVDFSMFRKAAPNAGQDFYRANAWNLVFYNQQTLNESLSLMKNQIDILAEDISILTKYTNRRSETHNSPSF